MDTLAIEDIFAELSDIARSQGTNTEADWKNLVDEVIDSHLTLGELDLDQSIEGMKDDLYARWTEYQESFDQPSMPTDT